MKYSLGALLYSLAGMSALCAIIYWLAIDIVKEPQDLVRFGGQLIATTIIGSGIITVVAIIMRQRSSRYYSLASNNASPTTSLQTLIALSIDDTGKHSAHLDALLNEFGLTTLHASNYEQMTQLCQQNSIVISFINFDLASLSSGQAVSHLRSAQQNHARLPIIATSNHASKEHICKALIADFDDYMVTPLDENKLKIQLQRWLHRDDITSTDIDTKTNTKKVTAEHNNMTTIDISNTDIEKVVNIEESLKQSNNNSSLAMNMLALLIKMIHEEKSNIHQLHHEKNWHELGQLTHKLYGGSCYCGVPNLQKYSQAIDKKIQQKDYHNLDNDFDGLMRSMEEILAWDQEYDVEVIFDTNT